MLLEHVKFSFEVELVADAHIGDGARMPLKQLRPKFQFERDAAEADSEVATLVRDYRGAPTLPPTALKGALRKTLLRQMHADEVDLFFGSTKSETDGAMGQFALYAGEFMVHVADGSSALPYWNDQENSWVSTRVALSRKHGAAEHKKLFSKEMLAAGSVFKVSGVWFSTLERAKVNLPRILEPLANAEGLTIGAGMRLGQGALRLRNKTGQVLLQQVRFVPETGKVEDRVLADRLTIEAGKVFETSAQIQLYCPGPFLSVDSTAERGRNQANLVRALKRNQDTPALQLSSIAGSLRSRAAWISAAKGWGGDDRFRKPSSWTSVEQLSPVERLFGVAGWRGLLRLSQPQLLSASAHRELTSNSLDRFTGAVLDAALFSYEVFTGVELDLKLILERRVGANKLMVPLKEDIELYDALLDDLKDDVLMLGHATNRGFGWFDVKSINRFEAA